MRLPRPILPNWQTAKTEEYYTVRGIIADMPGGRPFNLIIPQEKTFTKLAVYLDGCSARPDRPFGCSQCPSQASCTQLWDSLIDEHDGTTKHILQGTFQKFLNKFLSCGGKVDR